MIEGMNNHSELTLPPLKRPFPSFIMNFILIIFFIFSVRNSALPSIRFKGVVYDDKTNPLKNFSLRISSYGTITTTNSGEFAIEIPDNAGYVEIEMTDRNWKVIYPFDKKIPVPADENYLSKIVVSKLQTSPEGSVEIAARKYSRIESVLKSIGASQDELKDLIRKFIESESEENNINESVLKQAIFAEKRGESFSKISESLLNYILRMQNLRDNFRLISGLAFENDQARLELTNSVEEYGKSFYRINENKYTFQNDVKLYWDSGGLADDLLETIEYAVDEIHRPYILKLNESIVVINKVEFTELSRKEKKDLEEKTKGEINRIVGELETRIPILERKSNTILTKLKERG